MIKVLSLGVFAILTTSACSHPHTGHGASGAKGHHDDREFNPLTGNYERQPPFGPRSNKATR